MAAGSLAIDGVVSTYSGVNPGTVNNEASGDWIPLTACAAQPLSMPGAEKADRPQ